MIIKLRDFVAGLMLPVGTWEFTDLRKSDVYFFVSLLWSKLQPEEVVTSLTTRVSRADAVMGTCED